MRTIQPHTPNESRSIDPNHHLWRNGRLWWIAFTIHTPPYQKQRVRFSLGTPDVVEARRRRDAELQNYARRDHCSLSLRFGGRIGEDPVDPEEVQV